MIPTPLASPPTTVELIEGFSQGEANNCASIAAIKAAMKAFGGVHQVVAELHEQGDVILAKLRDGSRVIVSREEFDDARELSAFKHTSDGLLAHAHLLYAIMGNSYAQRELGGDTGDNCQRALKTLSMSGLYWSDAIDYLGLGPHAEVVADRKLPFSSGWIDQQANTPDGFIIQNAWHAWFASEGKHDQRGSVSEKVPFHFPSGIQRVSALIAPLAR